ATSTGRSRPSSTGARARRRTSGRTTRTAYLPRTWTERADGTLWVAVTTYPLGAPMAQTERAAIYRALKGAGVEFTKHYREYSVEELSALAAQHGVQVEPPARTERDLPAPRGPEDEGGSIRDELRQLSQTVNQLVQLQLAQVKEPAQAPVKQRGAREPETEQARGYMRDSAPTVSGLGVHAA